MKSMGRYTQFDPRSLPPASDRMPELAGTDRQHSHSRTDFPNPPFQAFDAVALLRNAVATVRSCMGSTTIVMDFVSDRESLPVVSDADMLESLAVYLLSNAAQNTDRGRIALILNAGPSVIRMMVTDTGRGMTEEMQRSVFSQRKGNDRCSENAYGLALVRRLIDLSGGAFEIASKPGEGTIIQVLLPVLVREQPMSRSW